MRDEEVLVEFALTRLDHPDLDLEDVAVLLVRRVGPEQMLAFAAQSLADRGELRAPVFEAAVERVMRVVLGLRDARD